MVLPSHFSVSAMLVAYEQSNVKHETMIGVRIPNSVNTTLAGDAPHASARHSPLHMCICLKPWLAADLGACGVRWMPGKKHLSLSLLVMSCQPMPIPVWHPRKRDSAQSH